MSTVEHRLTEHGTVQCPLERIRAEVDEDGECSACGTIVTPTPVDQPTTEPSECGAPNPGDGAGGPCLRRPGHGGIHFNAVRAWPLAPAPQPAADLVDAIQGEVWGWLNRHEVGSHLDDAKVLELALAVRDEMRQPAADTETEVQWGVRAHPGARVVTGISSKKTALEVIGLYGGNLVSIREEA